MTYLIFISRSGISLSKKGDLSMSATLHKRSRMLLALTLVLSMLFALGGFSAASLAARATGTVKNRVLNVRSSPSTSSSIVCKLSQGTKVTIIEEKTGDDGMKWYDVYFTHNGQATEGYVRADLVTTSGSTSGSGSSNTSSNTNSGSSSGQTGSGSTRYIKTNVARVRSWASTNADIRSRLEKGTEVTVISSTTGSTDGKTWYKISYKVNGSSQQGYVRSDLVGDSKPASTPAANNGGSTGGSTAITGTRYINVATARVRSYASTNGDIRARLARGTSVTLVASKTGDDGNVWYKIAYSYAGGTQQGYIRADLVTETAPAAAGGSTSTPSNNTGSNTNSVSVVYVRTYASPNADIRATLENGTKVAVIKRKTGDDGQEWTKISFTQNDATIQGYVPSSSLK